MKRVFLFLVCTFFAIGCVQAVVLSELSKDVTQVFDDIKLGDRLEITNKYGNIEFRVHNKNEIKAFINIKVMATSKSDAIYLLNKVDVEAYINKHWNNTEYSLKNVYYGSTDDNKKVDVNFVVYIPKDLIAIKVKNEFGNVYIEDYNLPFEADVKFGNFTAGRLTHNERTRVSVQYGKLQIDKAVAINAGVNYGEARIGSVEDLALTLQYSEGSVDNVSKLAIGLRHVSDLNIKSAGKVTVNELNFTSLNIESLINRFDMIAAQGNHSNIKIAVLSSKKFEGVKMNLSFTPMKLLLPKDIVAQCNLSSSQGKVLINNLSGENLVDNCFDGKRYVGILGKKRKGGDNKQLPKIDITNNIANIKVDVLD